ncbi:hypothetical protein ACFL2T_03455 [Elusimicrobiota bacterium]
MMPKAEEFGSLLSAVRREQGFPSAHAFYRKRGGQRLFGMSFANYLRLENGKSLPKGPRVAKLISLLGLDRGSPRVRELVYTYMKIVLGSDELLTSLRPGEDPTPPSLSLAETAFKSGMTESAVQLSLEQYRVLAKDRTAYGCHIILMAAKDWRDKKHMAKVLGVNISAVNRALKALRGVEMAVLAGGKAKSPLAGKFLTPPTPTPTLSSIFAALKRHRATWKKDRARLIHAPYIMTVSRQSHMEGYLPHLTNVVQMSTLFYERPYSKDAEIFLIEGRVFKLF